MHWNRVHKRYLTVSSFVEVRLNATLYPPAVIMHIERHAVRSDEIYFTEVIFLFPKKQHVKVAMQWLAPPPSY